MIELGHPSIPEVFSWGVTQYYEYLSMQLLGVDLEQYFEDEGNCVNLTLRNLGGIAIQMVRLAVTL